MLSPEELKKKIEEFQEALGEAIEQKDITCSDCQRNDVCECAFDLYNTYGDCLELK